MGACAPGPGETQLSFIDDSISDKNWSWRAGLNFKPNDDTLFYALVARGVKSGGFFNGITTNSFALAPYKPEKLTDTGLQKVQITYEGPAKDFAISNPGALL